MTTTTLLRSWWAPPCQGPFSRVALYGKGVVSVRPAVVDAVHALSACLEAHGYQTRGVDTGAYNCRKITGGTGYSLHAYGTALDINWQSNPYGPRLVTDMPSAMVAAVKTIRTGNGKQVWRWGGDYSGNKDAMHFEVVCHPSDLATGIDPASLPSAQPKPTPKENPFMALTDAQQKQLLADVAVIKQFADRSHPSGDIKVSGVWGTPMHWRVAEAVTILRQLASRDPAVDLDEAAIASLVLEGLDPAAIAAAIPGGIAKQVADEIAQRLDG